MLIGVGRKSGPLGIYNKDLITKKPEAAGQRSNFLRETRRMSN